MFVRCLHLFLSLLESRSSILGPLESLFSILPHQLSALERSSSHHLSRLGALEDLSRNHLSPLGALMSLSSHLQPPCRHLPWPMPEDLTSSGPASFGPATSALLTLQGPASAKPCLAHQPPAKPPRDRQSCPCHRQLAVRYHWPHG